jgi:hypothetical protein
LYSGIQTIFSFLYSGIQVFYVVLVTLECNQVFN